MSFEDAMRLIRSAMNAQRDHRHRAGILVDTDEHGRTVGKIHLRTYDDDGRMGYGVGWSRGWLWVEPPRPEKP
jgi:hypothetical protein